MRRLVKTPWCGPRRLGWGRTPITWQGWAVSVVFLVAMVVCGEFIRGIPTAIVEIGLVALLMAVCALPGAWPGRRR